MGREPRIFLSHSGADTEPARELKRRLLAGPAAQAAGLKVWFDKDDLRAGQWQPQIEQAIVNDATAFIVYVGSRGVVNWVDIEVRTALSRAATDKTFLFIPVLAAEGATSALPPFAKLHQGVHDPLRDVEAFQKLLKAVLNLDWDVAPIVICEPFVGLRSMREEEADRFFGRAQEIVTLADKFRKHRLVAIVADSGTGKSSLAQAGFIPAFRGGALIDPTREDAREKIWNVVTMRPRADPAEGLRQGVEIAATKLGRSLTDIASLRDDVSLADASRTAFALRCGLAPDRTSMLLIVDQFEELFTATSDTDGASFVALLLALADGPSDVRILLTVRSDYFNLASGVKDSAGRPALFERLTTDNNDAILRLKAMSPEGLREAVLVPLKLAGADNETALADAVQTDISHQASGLPLLQVALRAAWQERKATGRPMLECYQVVGRVSGALAREADKARSKLPKEDQGRLESIFVRLVRLGDTGGATRREALLSEFDAPRQNLIREKLGTDEYGRLVSVGETHAELSHEALITQWPWLQSMLKTNATDVRWLARLMERTKEWSAAPDERKANYLATGAEREKFHDLRERRGDWLSDADRDFVAVSERAYQDDLDAAEARQREREEEQARQIETAKKLATAASDLAASEQRTSRRTRIGALVAFLFAIAAGAFGLYARHERNVAEEAAQEAQRQLDRANRELAASINSGLGSDPLFPLTSRQRNTLWKLALTNEPVKSDFISIMAGSSEETVRISPWFAQIWRALGLLRPSAEAGRILEPLVKQFGQTTNPDMLQALAPVLQALAPKLNEAQTSQALELLLKQMGQATESWALVALAPALQALAPKLSEAQTSQALELLLEKIGEETDSEALEYMALALQALAPKLSEAQTSQALELLLEKISQTTINTTGSLIPALPALAGKLSEAQTSQALGPLFKQIGQTTNLNTLAAQMKALEALAPELSKVQTREALEPVLKQIGQVTDPYGFLNLAEALQALGPSAAQASQALDAVLRQIGKTTRPIAALESVVEALQVLAPWLSEAQTSQALEPLLKQIGEKTDREALTAQAEELQALAPKLSDAQVSQVLELLLKQPPDAYAPGKLAPALQALVPKLSEAQVSQALELLLKQIGQTTFPDALRTLAQALQALPVRLTEAQASQALDTVLTKIGQTTPNEGKYDLQALAQALQALTTKVSEAQASRALEPLLEQIGRTTDFMMLEGLAEVLQALAAKLTDAQAVQASNAAVSSLAWAANDEEAAEWARALVALTNSASDRDKRLVAAIAYPTAAGSATDVLFDAIRTGHPEAPAKEKGTEAGLEWLAKKFPEVLHPPVCPQPLQAGLECPPSASQ